MQTDFHYSFNGRFPTTPCVSVHSRCYSVKFWNSRYTVYASKTWLFLLQMLMNCISANVHVMLVWNVLLCTADFQSLAPVTDCSIDNSLIKTVPLLVDALPQLFHVTDLVLVNTILQNPSPQLHSRRGLDPTPAERRIKSSINCFSRSTVSRVRWVTAPSCWQVMYSKHLCEISQGRVAT